MRNFLFCVTIMCLVSCREQSSSVQVPKDSNNNNNCRGVYLRSGAKKLVLSSCYYIIGGKLALVMSRESGSISSVTSDILLGASYYQLIGGLYEIGHDIFVDLFTYCNKKTTLEKLSFAEIASNRDQNYLEERKKADYMWRKASSIVRSITNLAFSAQFTFLCLSNEPIKSMPYPVQNCDSRSDIFCSAYFFKSMAIIGSVSMVYNLWEVIQNSKQQDRSRGDIPAMGLATGILKSLVSSEFFRPHLVTHINTENGNLIRKFSASIHKDFFTKTWRLPEYFPVFDPMTGFIIEPYGGYGNGNMLSEHMHQVLNLYGTYEIFANLFQCVQNSITPPELTLEINTYEDETYSKKNLRKKRIRRNPTVYDAEPYEREKTERSLKNVLLVTNLSSKDSETSKPPKIKRRGKPTSIEESNNDVTETGECLDRILDPKIEEALEEINSYRRNKTVKKKVINSILDKCCKRIEGKINPIDGSEYAIVFFVNGRKVSIKFEISHGQDCNVYRKPKLTNVLNAIETAYMYHLDERSIKTYMQKHGIEKFHHIPKHLVHILFKRPEF